ncbi:MAG: hypothetical protein LAT57_04420 [Balneolales bacterium]|nr:hypothetical protein [Balneolales bacterium]
MNLRIPSVLIILVIAGCASTAEITAEEEVKDAATSPESVEFDFGFNIEEYRVRPENIFYSNENNIPEVFEIDESSMSEAQRNAGFRVQIISTQDVRLVEEMRREFSEWMYQDIPEYEPETYILFRQPFFRLHVGNFRSRTEAIEFSTFVKRKYPDAWVVHDQIDPESITVKQQITVDNN